MAKVFRLLVLLAISLTPDAAPRDLKFTLLRSYNDMKFNDRLLFERVVKSRLKCARECSRIDHCLHFTFISGGEQVDPLCRGHGDMTTTSRTPADGATSFSFKQDWTEQPCADDTDCETQLPEDYVSNLGPLASPICFRQRCLCYPGYFFSLSRALCVQDCSQSDLQDSYTRYPESGIVGNNHYTISGTVEECKDYCSSINNCENFEIISSSDETVRRKCHGARVSGYATGFTSPDYGWDHYQRDCA